MSEGEDRQPSLKEERIIKKKKRRRRENCSSFGSVPLTPLRDWTPVQQERRSHHRKGAGWLLWWQTIWMAVGLQKKERLTVHSVQEFLPEEKLNKLRPEVLVARGSGGCSGRRNSKSKPTVVASRPPRL